MQYIHTNDTKFKMNISKFTTVNTTEAISARKESLVALEEALKKKVFELREICLKEGELTGQLPVEYPLQPREPLPQVRRKVEMIPQKEPPKRTTSNTSPRLPSTISSKNSVKMSASSSLLPKHSSTGSHAIKTKDCPPSLLGEHNKINKLEAIHQQILQIQSAYDPNKVTAMSTSSSRSNSNFKVPSIEKQGLAYDETRSRIIPIRNHSESSIDQGKLKNKYKQEAILGRNVETSRPPRDGLQSRADVSSISFKTMIHPTNSTQDISLHQDNGLSKPVTSQNLEQSIKLANLHEQILMLQASKSKYGLPNKDEANKIQLTSSRAPGSLDEVNSIRDQKSNAGHQRVLSDRCGYYGQQIQSNRLGPPVVQLNNNKISKSRPKSPKPNFNITEIPAESNREKSPTVVSTESIGDENINPLTSKVSQLSITGVGNFQPYWEETKPYELSDFYKYSAKHRTGGNTKNNYIEKMRNTRETISEKSHQEHDIIMNSKKLEDLGDNNNRSTTPNKNSSIAQYPHASNNSNVSSSSPSSTHHHQHRPSSHQVNKQQLSSTHLTTSNKRTLATLRYA